MLATEPRASSRTSLKSHTTLHLPWRERQAVLEEALAAQVVRSMSPPQKPLENLDGLAAAAVAVE